MNGDARSRVVFVAKKFVTIAPVRLSLECEAAKADALLAHGFDVYPDVAVAPAKALMVDLPRASSHRD
jgi:hypothetical protein